MPNQTKAAHSNYAPLNASERMILQAQEKDREEIRRTPTEITNLPPEVLEIVYHHLESIDDVHSFARAHSLTHHVVKRRTIYTRIMRSIIGRSPHHRYDILLCNALKLHGDAVRHFQEDGTPFAVSSNHEGYNEWELALARTTIVPTCISGPCTACLPDEVIYDVLARYQGLRVFEDLWLKRPLEESDFLAVDVSQNVDEFACRYTRLLGRARDFEQGDLGTQGMSQAASCGYINFNADQRGRFYSAVTFVWVLNELRWMLTNFVYPAPTQRHEALLDRCKSNLQSLCHKPVLDQLDQHAIFAFMYHHTLPLQSSVLQDQNSSKLPLTFSSEYQMEATQNLSLLQLFLLAGQAYLQPPDLIDLTVRNQVSRSPPYPRLGLPVTTEQWARPSSNFNFPPNLVLNGPFHERRLLRLLNLHVATINRSFAQFQANAVIPNVRRSLLASISVKDYTQQYYVDSAVDAIERGESYREDLSPLREVVLGQWRESGMWTVWWWANSEDKARAILVRWREKAKS